MTDRAREILDELADHIGRLPTDDDKIQVLNEIRLRLHVISPLKDNPVDCVIWVRSDEVQANSWNPNTVAGPEMLLLEHSIAHDGYTQPVVTMQLSDRNFEVVDGWHRTRVVKESEKVRTRTMGYLPIVTIRDDNKGRNDLVAATVRHNRARGRHGISPMISIVADMFRRGWDDDRIAKELGMGEDEILRLKQNTGLPEMFKDHRWSKSWE